jgi:Acetohydroxy acid isomeroreductase, NADPH-binding domain
MTDNGDARVKVYGAADAPARGLADETVAILGYGYMGRTAALNLKDSGARVRIGNREDEYAARARAEGFEVVPLATAATDDIVFVLLPDEVIPGVFATEIAPGLRTGSALAFASGYSLAFGLIHPPEIVDGFSWPRAWRESRPGPGSSKAKDSGPASESRRTAAGAHTNGCLGWPPVSAPCGRGLSR